MCSRNAGYVLGKLCFFIASFVMFFRKAKPNMSNHSWIRYFGSLKLVSRGLEQGKKGKKHVFFWSTPSRPWKLKSSWSIGITVTLWCNIHLMNPRSHYKSIQLNFFGLIFWWNPNMFVYAEEFGMKPWQSSKILNLDITFASAIARISKKMLRSLGSLYLQNTNLSNPYK